MENGIQNYKYILSEYKIGKPQNWIAFFEKDVSQPMCWMCLIFMQEKQKFLKTMAKGFELF